MHRSKWSKVIFLVKFFDQSWSCCYSVCPSFCLFIRLFISSHRVKTLTTEMILLSNIFKVKITIYAIATALEGIYSNAVIVVSSALCLLGTMQTTVFARSLSNFTCKLLVRAGIPWFWGHEVKVNFSPLLGDATLCVAPNLLKLPLTC